MAHYVDGYSEHVLSLILQSDIGNGELPTKGHTHTMPHLLYHFIRPYVTQFDLLHVAVRGPKLDKYCN